jgi:hypothetical protein
MYSPSRKTASRNDPAGLRDGMYYVVLALYYLLWPVSVSLALVSIFWLIFEEHSSWAFYLNDERRMLVGFAAGTVIGVRVAIWARRRARFHAAVAWTAAAGFVACGTAAVVLFQIGEVVAVVGAVAAAGIGVACVVPGIAALCGISVANTERLIARFSGAGEEPPLQ